MPGRTWVHEHPIIVDSAPQLLVRTAEQYYSLSTEHRGQFLAWKPDPCDFTGNVNLKGRGASIWMRRMTELSESSKISCLTFI